MARLTLVPSTQRTSGYSQAEAEYQAHRAASTEGEAVKRLLEANGFECWKESRGESQWACPFHEGPDTPKKRSPNFYVNAETGVYTCHSASCAERGNRITLERFFGITEAEWGQFQSRDQQLSEFEQALTPSLREPFYKQGLTDTTIERFRLGWDNEFQRYVIPYLEGRRPVFFRYYNPNPRSWIGDDGKEHKQLKYYWEENASARLFNPGDAVGDSNGRVFIAEGEIKTMLLVQLGYAAVGVPGANIFKSEWQAHFSNARRIYVCFDSDNPDFHVHDPCARCTDGPCEGHNPGQENAERLVERLGWRASNIVLPLPDEYTRKTDINEYFMRDGHTGSDFAELALGEKKTPYVVSSLAQIMEAPPPESEFLVEQGILSAGGRLLVAGRPKAGKSLFINNMALSLAAGIPFLNRYKVDHPTRVLLLDRELSKRALYNRLLELMEDRPGYRAAMENLLIDHDHLLKLDVPASRELLLQLIEQNGAEVVMLDTAYKFFTGDFEKSSGLSRAFDTLDYVIQKTGCSVVLTHHHRKGHQSKKADENTDFADPENVAGSFLWTGWPNATILLNFLNRSVENPFDVVATFTAFRDAAPPSPVALYRSRESIAYTAITDYHHGAEDMANMSPTPMPISSESLSAFLLEVAPIPEEDFLHKAMGKFGARREIVRPYLLDLLDQGHFVREGHNHILKYVYDREEETWEAEHGLPEPERKLFLVEGESV